MLPELVYDPTFNGATLVAHGEGWYLWLARPDGAPMTHHFVARAETADLVGDAQLSSPTAVIQLFERCLIRLGYSVVREEGPRPADWMAVWQLAPGQN